MYAFITNSEVHASPQQLRAVLEIADNINKSFNCNLEQSTNTTPHHYFMEDLGSSGGDAKVKSSSASLED